MKSKYFLPVLFILLFSLLLTAASPKTLTVQGRLEQNGALANGSFDMVFKIYTAASGGSALYTETHNSSNQVSVVNGFFSTTLGDITALSLPFDQQYYVGVTVGADSEMSPRIKLTASPYALTAKDLNLSKDLNLDAGTFFIDITQNRVGIGTTSPTNALKVVGDINATGTYYGDGSNLIGISTGNCDNNASCTLTGTINTLLAATLDNNVTFNQGAFFFNKDNNRLGIGTTSPDHLLHVGSADGIAQWGTDFGAQVSGDDGGESIFGSNLYVDSANDIKTAGTHGSYGYAGMRASWGNLYLYSTTGATTAGATVTPTARLFVQGSSGNVGIGTASPQGTLHVKVPSGGGGFSGYSATGGTITYDGDYTIHTFTSSGTFTPNGPLTIEYLVIGGGGGGTGLYYGGGGGAGGYRNSVQGELSGGGSMAESPVTLSAQAYSITVGAGGAGGGAGTPGSNGGNSSIGSLIVSNGGCGGSGSCGSGSGTGTSAGASTSATVGQGSDGSNSGSVGGRTGGGGGGGAGQTGNAGGTLQSNGGAGLSSSITGSAVTRAGGGGGAMNANNTYYVSSGGAGGGGNGAADYLGPTVQAVAGIANTGGGGGAGCWSNTPNGAAGGSGIVIIRYLTPKKLADSLVVNSTSGFVGIGKITPDTALDVNGVITGIMKNFKIDHPTKQNNYLVHSSLEGPESAVYYRGSGKLIDSQAKIELPKYFDALTRDKTSTVLLTSKGTKPFLLSYDNFNEKSFVVYGSAKEGEFDWEVKAVRADVQQLETEPQKK